MHQDGLLPATGVRVGVQPPPNSRPSARLIPKGTRAPILRGFAPLVIVALIVVLFLGGTGGILVVVAIGAMAALVVGLVQRDKYRSRQLYSTSPDDWMSRTAIYWGPFDHTGLPGAANFDREHRGSQSQPQVRLLVTDDGFVFGPGGHRGTPMTVPFGELESVDLIEGTRPRMLVVTPPIADRVGQVVLRTLMDGSPGSPVSRSRGWRKH